MRELFNVHINIFIRPGQQTSPHRTNGERKTTNAKVERTSCKQFSLVINCAIKCSANYFIISTGSGDSHWERERETEAKAMNINIKLFLFPLRFVCRARIFHVIRAKMIFSIFIRLGCCFFFFIFLICVQLNGGGTNLTVTPFVIMFLFCQHQRRRQRDTVATVSTPLDHIKKYFKLFARMRFSRQQQQTAAERKCWRGKTNFTASEENNKKTVFCTQLRLQQRVD